MPTKKQRRYHIESHHFVIIFWLVTALLYGGKLIVASWLEPEDSVKTEVAELEAKAKPDAPKAEKPSKDDATEAGEQKEGSPKPEEKAPKSIALPDSIEEARRIVDEIFLCRRKPIAYLDAEGKPIRNKVRQIDSSERFNDLNDVQLATASLIGASERENRKDVRAHSKEYVYIGSSPYFDIQELTYSVPYLVPRAAILLDEIGHAFIDSLTAKGLPFHKLQVTSVLRTNEDVAKLTQSNSNATEQSCHRFGTTFDIAYTVYERVNDPDGEQLPAWSARDLKAILAEVLDDQRRMGTCYVKHENRKRCFHITCR